jgi:hypothetical protein
MTKLEKPRCKVCGSPLITIVPGELMRCPIDGLYHHIRPKLPTSSQLKKLPKTKVEIVELGGEQLTFIDRVVDKLTSSRTNPNWKAPKSIRDKMRLDFTEVVLGKKNLAEWFSKTRQDFNLRDFELAQILYDSLEGLKSTDAQRLREEWLQFIQSERKSYGL